MLAASLAAGPDQAGRWPVDVYCSTGDHLWVAEREPVDSPAAIEAMMEWMAGTYGTRRVYWRAGGTEIWDRHYKVGRDRPLQYDWAIDWKRSLFREERINEAAVAAAHERDMEIFLYTGLFEHGVQPDVGIIAPYLVEDTLRIRHPEWCMLDRWGERRCPGPLSLAYPEVRRRLIARMVEAVRDSGYDGVTFYSYVENVGLRYLDEFGFNEPVIARFRERYPDVDPSTGQFTEEQRAHWRRCRGEFVTQYLRELHEALAAEGASLMMILDAKEPDVPQPWWSKPTAGTGPIHLDWEAWVREGIVDGVWVQLGGMTDQRATLDRVLAARGGRDLDVVVRTAEPWRDDWAPYVEAGVTPVAVITAPTNGIERLTLAPTSAETLASPDWRLRVQTLADAADGKLALTREQIAPFAADEHLLVRRRAMHALAALNEPEAAALIERGLDDAESSVRIAAAASLARCHRPASARAILDALTRDGGFQFKQACVGALAAMGTRAFGDAVAGARSDCVAVREVCVRALYRIGRGGMAEQVMDELASRALDPTEAPEVRYHSIEGMVGLRLKVTQERRARLAADLIALLRDGAPPMVEQQAAEGLGYAPPEGDADLEHEALEVLEELLRRYGDGCDRPDAAYGWRVVGNAILRRGAPGAEVLERLRTQPDDRWLAWITYEVAHVPQTGGTMQIVDEAEAIEVHERLAPEFPGRRRW